MMECELNKTHVKIIHFHNVDSRLGLSFFQHVLVAQDVSCPKLRLRKIPVAQSSGCAKFWSRKTLVAQNPDRAKFLIQYSGFSGNFNIHLHMKKKYSKSCSQAKVIITPSNMKFSFSKFQLFLFSQYLSLFTHKTIQPSFQHTSKPNSFFVLQFFSAPSLQFSFYTTI